MKNSPLVSVIIPVYNVERYLRRCLDSVVNQTYRNLEIILVDDGSPDRCPEICDEYAERDSRIKVIHKKNGGQSEARNIAIDICRGEYIAFIDSDDLVSTWYIENLYTAINNHSVKFAICETICFSDYSEIGRHESLYSSKLLSKRSAIKSYCSLFPRKSVPFLAPFCKLYHRSLFQELRFPVGCIYEDSLLNYKLIDLVDEIAYINEPLYYYYMRENSTMGQKERHDYKIVLRPYQEAIAYFESLQKSDFAAFFFPPLLMREIYRYWIAKELNNDQLLSDEIFNLYCKDFALFKKSKGNFFLKIIFGILLKMPGLYSVYRRLTPGLVGGR